MDAILDYFSMHFGRFWRDAKTEEPSLAEELHFFGHFVLLFLKVLKGPESCFQKLNGDLFKRTFVHCDARITWTFNFLQCFFSALAR